MVDINDVISSYKPVDDITEDKETKKLSHKD